MKPLRMPSGNFLRYLIPSTVVIFIQQRPLSFFSYSVFISEGKLKPKIFNESLFFKIKH